MFPIFFLILLLAVFMFLFFREVQRDRAAFLALDQQNDARMIQLMKPYIAAQKNALTIKESPLQNEEISKYLN